MKLAGRILKIVVALVVLLAVGVGIVIWQVGKSGSGAIEQWVGNQILAITNGYLKPVLSFEDLDYEYPLTVRLRNLRLTAPDPGNGGKGLDVISADAATVILAEVPRVGQPIRIEKILLNKPAVQAVAVEPGSSKFIGLSEMMRGEAPAGPTPKLSEVFVMRLVELVDAKIVYDPRLAGQSAMVLDQINTRLDIVPTSDGWYKLAMGTKRAPVFELSTAGKLNIDTFDAEELAIDLKTRLGREQDQFLPPQLQQILKQHEVTGTLDLKVSGGVSISDMAKNRLQATVKLDKAHVSAGEYRIPIEKLNVVAELKDNQASLPQLRLDALGGYAEVSGAVKLNERLDGQVSLKAVNMLLEETLQRKADAKEPPKYAGRLNANLKVNAPLAGVIARAMPQPVVGAVELPAQWGGGEVRLEQARLAQIAVLRSLNETIAKAGSLVGMAAGDKSAEKVGLVFKLGGNLATFSQIEYGSPLVAVQGKGTIALDQTLDLKFSGGPAAVLGKSASSAFNKVAGKVAAYTVTGTVADPKVGVELAGGALGGVGEKAGEAGKAVEKIGEGLMKGLLNKDKK